MADRRVRTEGHLSAADAARALGVSLPTLYAYVSRGLVRSEARPGTRERRYRAEDVVALRQRSALRRDPAAATREALHFGAPVLDSSLALIADGQLYLRGIPVASLVEGTFEETASLLWSGDRHAPFPDATLDPLPPTWRELQRLARALPPIEGFQTVLAACAPHDAGAWDLTPAGVHRTGARVLRTLAAVATGGTPRRDPIAVQLAQRWAPRVREARRLFDTALVLWADHELNVSTFTARCVASARAHPWAAVIAALSAARGARHFGLTERVEALFDEVEAAGDAAAVVEARLRGGERLPGFGHVLYPNGDPRARMLLDTLREALPRGRTLDTASALERAAWDAIAQRPTIDFAAIALARGMRLPAGAALALVGIGRSVGWIAHVAEQLGDDRLIRPRARYVGELPVSHASELTAPAKRRA
jgi:citrate synthase